MENKSDTRGNYMLKTFLSKKTRRRSQELQVQPSRRQRRRFRSMRDEGRYGTLSKGTAEAPNAAKSKY